jgi:hypothetical protein
MLIGCGVAVAVGVWVGLAVAEGLGVLLGECVEEDVRVELGIRVDGAGVALPKLGVVLSSLAVHPAIIKNKNSPKAIPATGCSLLFLLVYDFILDGNCPGNLLYPCPLA